MRARLAPALLVLLSSSALGAQQPSAQPAIQTPEAFFGFPIGADRQLADWPSIERYVERVAAASPRVRVTDIGVTTDGRRLIAAIVSAPENIERLEEIRGNALRLADPRLLDAEAAQALVGRQPVIVAVGMSIHPTEVGATQAAPELLHTLATSHDPEVLAVLRDVVVILIPSLNPDGLAVTVDWYRQWKGTEFEGGAMPWLDHRYAGHDINRDGFMLNLAESRALADFLNRRWHPQVFLTMHQMGTAGPRFFVPPTMDPVAQNYDPLIWRTAGLLGHAMALALEEDSHSGVVQNALFDYYWPGYEDSAPLGHNTVTLLTEAASVKVATPITVAPESFESGRGFPDHRPSTTFPHPWAGGAWRLRDIVDYDLSAVRGLLGAAARYRAQIVRNFYRMGQRQVELGLKGGPFAFIIPPTQFDPTSAQKMRQLLLDAGIDVQRTLEPFRVAETVYPEGTDIILMAQPYRAYVVTLFERQDYPSRRAAGTLPERPYDVAGWTLPLQMNVRVDRIDQYFEPPATTRLDRVAISPARVWGEPTKAAYYVIDGRGNGATLAVNRLLKAGARVAWSAAPLQLQGYRYDPGAIVVTEGPGVRAVVEAAARDLGLRATAATGTPPPGSRPLATVRTGLYKPSVANTDEGWTRWLLEQYEFSFETLTDADIRRGGLRERFDAIILADEGADQLIIGHPSGTMPPEYTGGIGTEGAAMLKHFVEAGGTLVALDSAVELAVELLGAPLTNVTRGLGADEFFCPGSLVRLDLDSDPLTYGIPRETAAFFSFSGAFEIAPSSSTAPEGAAPAATVRIVGRYGSSQVLLSGWLEGEHVIAGKGAVMEVTSGQGRAVLLAFRAQHRAQSLATFRLLFNSIHTSR